MPSSTQGMKLVSPNDPTKPRWDRLHAECRRLIKLDPRLDGYLKGEIKPAGAGELCELALLCAWPSRRLFGEAARLYEQAFAARAEPRNGPALRLSLPRRRAARPVPRPERAVTRTPPPSERTGARKPSSGYKPIWRSGANKSNTVRPSKPKTLGASCSSG